MAVLSVAFGGHASTNWMTTIPYGRRIRWLMEYFQRPARSMIGTTV
jgi:hypothetical protein